HREPVVVPGLVVAKADRLVIAPAVRRVDDELRVNQGPGARASERHGRRPATAGDRLAAVDHRLVRGLLGPRERPLLGPGRALVFELAVRASGDRLTLLEITAADSE